MAEGHIKRRGGLRLGTAIASTAVGVQHLIAVTDSTLFHDGEDDTIVE